MKSRSLAVAAAVLFAAGAAHANDSKATIADFDARLAKIGAPKIEGKDAGGKVIGVSYVGHKK